MPAEIYDVDKFFKLLSTNLREMDGNVRAELNQFITSLNVALCLADSDTGKLIFQESKYIDLFKFEIKNSYLDLFSFLKLVHEEDKEQYFTFLEALKAGKLFKCRIRLLLGNLGKTRLTFDFRNFPIKGSTSLVVLQNITESVTTQMKLLEREVHYLKMLDLTPFGVAIHDGSTLVYINRTAMEMLGAQSPDQLVGKNILTFIPKDYQEIVKKRAQSLMENNTDIELIEEKFLRLDGTEIDVEVMGTTTYYQGRIMAQILFRDITKRKQYQQEIVFSERRFRRVFLNSPFIELILDDNFRVKALNRVALKFFDDHEIDWEESSFIDILSEEIQDMVRALTEENLVINMNQITLITSNRPICDFTIVFVKTEEVEYFVLLEDVTEKVKLQSELEIRNKLDTLGLLASGLSHDFNNVLTNALGYIELLKTEFPELPDQVMSFIDQIEAANLRGKQLISRLQGLSAGEKEDVKGTDLGVVMSELRKLITPRLGDISLIVSEKEGFPMVAANFNDLFQVFLNLLTNSIDALQDREGERWIEVSFVEDAQCVLVSVSDNGSGISEKDKKEIFQPFFSTKTSKNESRGLGLVTVQSIVSRLGGQITVHSEIDRGTTFLLSLPKSEDAKCYLFSSSTGLE